MGIGGVVLGEPVILNIVDYFAKWMDGNSVSYGGFCPFNLGNEISVVVEPVYKGDTFKVAYYKLLLSLPIYETDSGIASASWFLDICNDLGIRIGTPDGSTCRSLYHEEALRQFSTAREVNAFIDHLESITKAKYPNTQFWYHRDNSSSSGGCYVATAVYGSYDCPQVWTLRRYRDQFLSESLLGRAFIRLYYAVSPTAVRLFGNTGWFNRFFRKHLDCFVASLLERGFSDAYYQDKNNRGV